MTLIQCKDEFIYLMLVSFFIYLGAYFSASFTPSLVEPALFKIIAHVLLVFNACAIYWSVVNFLNQRKSAFLVASLYLLSPTHADVFLHFYQLQSLLAETFLLLCFIAYYLNFEKKGFLFLAASVLLNTKLIVFYIVFLFFKKSTTWQKIFIGIHSFVTIIFLIPYYRRFSSDLLFKPQVVLYSLDLLFLPLKRSILDLSIINPDFYSRLALIVLSIVVILISIYYLNQKNKIGKLASSFILVSLCGTFIPLKNYFSLENNSIYYNPTSYPLILFSFLLVIILLAMYRERLTFIIIYYFAIFWTFSGIVFQKNTLDALEQWNDTIYSLPKSFNKEEEIKLLYANVLIENKDFDKAERLVNESRMIFPNEAWYQLAIDLAKKRRDSKGIEKLNMDLRQFRIPFKVD